MMRLTTILFQPNSYPVPRQPFGHVVPVKANVAAHSTTRMDWNGMDCNDADLQFSAGNAMAIPVRTATK